MTLSGVKDTLAAVQSLATIVALLAGAWWFVKQNQDAPRLKVEHMVSAHEDPASAEKLIIAVEVKATNTGNTPISIPAGRIRLISIMSDPPLELDKVRMEDRWLEPGESDQLYFRTYRVPAKIGTLQIETHVPSDHNTEWETSSLFDVKRDSKTYAATENAGKKR